MSSASRGDTVALKTGALMDLQRVYRDISSVDKFVVTRVDKSRGRRALYLRKVGDQHKVIQAWTDQVVVVTRLVPTRGGRG